MKSSDAEKSVQKESPHMQFVSKQRIVAESKHQRGNLGHKASFVAKKKISLDSLLHCSNDPFKNAFRMLMGGPLKKGLVLKKAARK